MFQPQCLIVNFIEGSLINIFVFHILLSHEIFSILLYLFIWFVIIYFVNAPVFVPTGKIMVLDSIVFGRQSNQP